MDLSNKAEIPVCLHSTDLESLKVEVAKHLTQAVRRKTKDTFLTSYKIPMGFGGLIEVGQELTYVVPFGVAGKLANFISYLPASSKDVQIVVEIRTGAITQIVKEKLRDEFRAYSFSVEVPALSFGKLIITNQGKTPVETLIGFTFEETKQDEIKALRFVGTM